MSGLTRRSLIGGLAALITAMPLTYGVAASREKTPPTKSFAVGCGVGGDYLDDPFIT